MKSPGILEPSFSRMKKSGTVALALIHAFVSPQTKRSWHQNYWHYDRISKLFIRTGVVGFCIDLK